MRRVDIIDIFAIFNEKVVCGNIPTNSYARGNISTNRSVYKKGLLQIVNNYCSFASIPPSEKLVKVLKIHIGSSSEIAFNCVLSLLASEGRTPCRE